MIVIPVIVAGVLLGILAYRIGHRKNGKKERSWIITAISVIFGITVIVAGILLVAVLDPSVEVKEGVVQVSGLYKRNIALDDIEEVSLEEGLPEVVHKLSGFNMGNTYRGTFRMEDGETSTMFVQREAPPYLHIRTSERLFVINFRDSQETEELYEEILEEIK